MTVKPHDAPWGMPVALVTKAVVDLFYQASLHGRATVTLTPQEIADVKAAFQALRMPLPGVDLSKAGVTAYQLFLPAFEEYAQYYSNNPQPDTQVNLARLARDYQARKASGNFTDEYYNANSDVQVLVQALRGDGSTAWDQDLTLWGTPGTICDILIVNGLDAPLTLADTYVGHGYPIYYPNVMQPLIHGDPVEVAPNVIPGRTGAPDGTDRFGLGLFRFQKGDGAFYGTEGAMQFTTPDPAAPKPIGIAWGLDYHNNPSTAATADLSQYNSLQAFYEATTMVSKSNFGEGMHGVSVNCYIDYTSGDAPLKDDGHRLITVVIQPTGGVKEAGPGPAAAKNPLPQIMKNIARTLPKPAPQPAPPFIGAVDKHGIGGGNHLPPNVVPFVNDDGN
ncbi:MAG: hypothetical protein WAT70_04660 [Rhizobiaceae bacterium]